MAHEYVPSEVVVHPDTIRLPILVSNIEEFARNAGVPVDTYLILLGDSELAKDYREGKVRGWGEPEPSEYSRWVQSMLSRGRDLSSSVVKITQLRLGRDPRRLSLL